MSRIIALLSLALMLQGCASWFGGRDTGRPPNDLVGFEASARVTKAWSHSVGTGAADTGFVLSPAVAEGRVFAAGTEGRVKAFDAYTGERLWDVDLDVTISAGPGAGSGMVLVGTADAEVYALDQVTGETLWRTRVSSEVLSAPVADEGVVVVRTIDGRLASLQGSDGAPRWLQDRAVPALSLRGTGTPTISESLVLDGFDGGRLVAVGLRDGRVAWEHAIAAPRGRTEIERMVDVDSRPVVVSGAVYAVSFQGRVVALELEGGQLLWQRDMSSHAGLDADAANLYISDEIGHVWALDRYNSASLWRQEKLEGRRLSAPASHEDYVVVGDFEGYTHWLRQEDGQFAARHRVDSDGIGAAPVSAYGYLYVLGLGGTLAALRIE